MTKKLMYLAFFAAFTTGALFAQTYGEKSFGIYTLNDSFDVSNFQKNNGFTINPRLSISQLEISQSGAFALNLVIGLGLGSFLQGDTTGGIVGLLGEIGGYGLMIGGGLIASSNKTTDASGETTIHYDAVSMTMLIGGMAVLLGTRIFEVIRPWYFN